MAAFDVRPAETMWVAPSCSEELLLDVPPHRKISLDTELSGDLQSHTGTEVKWQWSSHWLSRGS